MIQYIAAEHAAGRPNVALADVAERIAAEVGDLDDGYKRHYIALHQHHAPILAEHEVIDWDQDQQFFRATERCLAIAALLDDIEDRCAGRYTEPVLETNRQ